MFTLICTKLKVYIAVEWDITLVAVNRSGKPLEPEHDIDTDMLVAAGLKGCMGLWLESGT